MIPISPKNVFLASLAILIFGLAMDVVFSATIPLVGDLAFRLALAAGCLGIPFAWYYAAVNYWDSGRRALSVVFLAFPLVFCQVSLFSQARSLAELAGSVVGTLILVVVGILIGLWAKNLIKRYLFGIKPEPTSSPPALADGPV